MKRLLAQIGITYFSVLAAAFYLSRGVVLILGGIALFAAILFFCIRKIRKTIFIPAMAIAAMVACVVNLSYTTLFVEPTENSYGESAHTVRAVLAEEEYQAYSKYYYRLNTTEIDGEKVSRRLLLKTLYPLDAEPDDTIVFTSDLHITENRYYRAKGYLLTADSFETEITVEPAASHSLYYHAIQIRRFMRRTLEAVLPSDCAALCRAILIGDKYVLDTEVKDGFRRAGASYFIVVSGMHFAVICSLIMFMLQRLHRWIRFIVMMSVVLLYAAITGFQPSVLRSGIMIALLILSRTVYRIPYAPNHLGIAGIVLPFIVTPYGAGDISLILSYYATLSILMWAGPIARKLCVKGTYGTIPRFHPVARMRKMKERLITLIKKEKTKKGTLTPPTPRLFFCKLWNTFAMMLSVCLAANILVFPISVFVFHGFSTVSLFSSVLLYWEIYLILILSFVICLFFWFKPLIILLAFPLMWLCKLVLFIVNGLSSLPFAYIHVSELYFYIWLIFSMLLGGAVILYRNHYRYLLPAMLCSVVILLAGGLTYTILQTQVAMLEVYSCGDGICAALNCGGKLHLLRMDARSKELYQVWDKLSDRYNSAETALCFDEKNLKHNRMYRGDEFAISKLLLYDKHDAEDEDESIAAFNRDTDFILDDDVMMKVTVRNHTPVPYIKAYGKTILIISDACEIEDIPENERSADIILLSRAKVGMERLRCQKLIISDDSDLALRTAKLLEACYQEVLFTAGHDVRCWLR